MTRALPDDRAQAEQNLRMREVFFDTEPTEAEILRRIARRRNALRRATEGAQRTVSPLGWGVLAGLLVSGSALALALHSGHVRLSSESAESEVKSDAPIQVQPPRAAPVPSASEATNRGAESQERFRTQGSNSRGTSGDVSRTQAERSGASQALRSEFPVQGSPDERVADEVQSRPFLPEVAAQKGTTAASSATRRSSAVASFPLAGGGAAEPQLSQAESVATWAKVAGSMREGEESRAAHELAPLARSSDPAERDAALILQLQLKLKDQESTSDQLTMIRHLAEHGASPSVRASARSLLNKILSSSSSSTPR